MRKRLVLLLGLITIFAFGTFTNVYAESPVKINVNGKEVKSDVDPYIKNGRTMVPVRFIAEELGAEVNYGVDEKYNFQWVSVAAPEDYLALSMIIGYPVAVISEGTYRSDVAPEIKDGRTMVPLRFISDYLNLDVNWDDSTKTVYLTKSKAKFMEKFNKYFDDNAYKKYTDWLTNPNNTREQFMDAHK